MVEPSAELIQFEIDLHDKKLEDMTSEMKTLRTKVHDINNSLSRTQGFLGVLEEKINELSSKLEKMSEIVVAATMIFKMISKYFKYIFAICVILLFVVDWSRLYFLGLELFHKVF